MAAAASVVEVEVEVEEAPVDMRRMDLGSHRGRSGWWMLVDALEPTDPPHAPCFPHIPFTALAELYKGCRGRPPKGA